MSIFYAHIVLTLAFAVEPVFMPAQQQCPDAAYQVSVGMQYVAKWLIIKTINKLLVSSGNSCLYKCLHPILARFKFFLKNPVFTNPVQEHIMVRYYSYICLQTLVT